MVTFCKMVSEVVLATYLFLLDTLYPCMGEDFFLQVRNIFNDCLYDYISYDWQGKNALRKETTCTTLCVL